MASNTIEYLLKVKDEASGALRGVGSSAGQASAGLAKAGTSSTGMAGSMIKAHVAMGAMQAGLKALKGATVGFAKAAITTGAQMEAFEVKLKVLLGSADAAKDRLDKLFEIGSTTPFALDQLIAAEVKLESFGVTGDRARQAVMDLGAFMDGDLVGAATAVGKAFVGGAGAADILREKAVLSMVSLKAGTDITKLSLNEFREVLIDTLTDPDGKIAGGTEAMAKTFNGLMSNLGDAWFGFKKQVKDAKLFDSAKETLVMILEVIASNATATSQWAQIIGVGLTKGMLLFLETMAKVGQITAFVSRILIESAQGYAFLFSKIPGFRAEAIQFNNTLLDWKEAIDGAGMAFAEVDEKIDDIQESLDELDDIEVSIETPTKKKKPPGDKGGADDIAFTTEVSEGVDPDTIAWQSEVTRDAGEMASMAEKRNAFLSNIISNTASLADGTIPGDAWWAQLINFLAIIGDEEYDLNWEKLGKTVHDAFSGAIKLHLSHETLTRVIIDAVVFGIIDAAKMLIGIRKEGKGETQQPEAFRKLNELLGTEAKVDSFQTGTKWIDRAGLAVLHRGEQVVPPGGATPTRAMGGGSSGLVVNVNAPLGIGPGTAEQLVRELNQILGARGLNLSVA